jgi:hypothetical protein
MRPDYDDLLDSQAILSFCGEDESCLEVGCRSFLRVLPARMADLRSALERGDAHALCESAHQACALLYAFSAIAGDLASELEDRAGLGDLERARPVLERLETIATRLPSLVVDLTVEELRAER